MTTHQREPAGSLSAHDSAAGGRSPGAVRQREARRSTRTDPEAAPPTGTLRRHGLLAYVLLAYGISWTFLVGGLLLTEAGALDPDGAVVEVVNQVAAAGPMLAAVVVVAISRGRA